jgi:hypothetical protein
MWFWILVKGVLLQRAVYQQKQQRFHFIDVHASWKCSSMILRGWAGVEFGTGEAVTEGVARQ